jgi:drug/metabolite transporter (DMT)-like permease
LAGCHARHSAGYGIDPPPHFPGNEGADYTHGGENVKHPGQPLGEVVNGIDQAMSNASDHKKGFIITLLGVLVLSPDTLLIRLVDSDPWTVMFWRGLMTALAMMVMFVAVEGRDWRRRLGGLGAPALLAAGFFALNSISFVLALHHTSVANTLLIVSTSPLFAALFSWVFLRERVRMRTWLAIFIACGGIAIIVSGSLARGSLYGDLIALGTAIGLAGAFVTLRHNREINMIPAAALGHLVAAVFALLIAAPQALSSTSFAWLLLMGALVLPLSFALISTGPRFIPAPEVSLLMLLETVLGPVIVWLALGETASREALVGGTVVILALAVHSALALRAAATA